MGFSYSTYHAYGMHVPDDQFVTDQFVTDYPLRETDRLDGVIRHTPGLSGVGLGYLTAGDYDRDELFIVCQPRNTYTIEVDLGDFITVNSQLFTDELPEWDRLLKQLAAAAGYKGLAEPGWLLIPDCS